MSTITKDCPIECLAPLLSRATFDALAAGIDSDPATVAHVIALYEHGGLMNLYNISSGRAGEIGRCLVAAGMIEPPSSEPPLWRRLPARADITSHHQSRGKAEAQSAKS